MFVYVGRTYTATATGQTLRAVVCERCDAEYFYSACRLASGAGSSPYGLNNRGAERRAQDHAQKALDRALRRAVDVVPCPHCGWLQPDMVRDVQRRRYGRVQKLAWVLPMLLLVPLLIAYFSTGDAHWNDDAQPVLLLMILAVAGVGAGASVLLSVLRRRFDPNERRPGGDAVAKLPPAPPPLVRTPWPASVVAQAQAAAEARGAEPAGAPTLDYYSGRSAPEEPSDVATDLQNHTLLMPPPAGADALPPDVARGWVTLQLPKVGWPRACECCLGEPQATYAQAVPFKVSEGMAPLPVPVCEPCRRKLRNRWWKWAGMVTLAVAGLAVAGYYFMSIDEVGRVALCIVLGGFAAVIGAPVIAGLGSRPHRCRTVDAERGFFRLWFENPAYARLMASAWVAPETHSLAVPNGHLENLVLAATVAKRAAAPRQSLGAAAAPAARR